MHASFCPSQSTQPFSRPFVSASPTPSIPPLLPFPFITFYFSCKPFCAPFRLSVLQHAMRALRSSKDHTPPSSSPATPCLFPFLHPAHFSLAGASPWRQCARVAPSRPPIGKGRGSRCDPRLQCGRGLTLSRHLGRGGECVGLLLPSVGGGEAKGKVTAWRDPTRVASLSAP